MPEPGLLDCFPSYVPFGHGELAIASEEQPILHWIATVSKRSFDAMLPPTVDEFPKYAAMLCDELRPALERVEILVEEQPGRHDAGVRSTELALVHFVGELCIRQSEIVNSNAQAWGAVMEVVGESVSVIGSLHAGNCPHGA
jgi:hypothetical protein